MLIQFDELCYPSEARENSFARNTGNSSALSLLLPDEGGFCSIESAYFHFRGSILENSQHQEIVTYPKEAKGLMQQVTLYTACDDAVADSFFGQQGYCADPCPKTKLQGSLACSEQCIVCADGKEVLDCSNIHASLVEECGDESAFVRALLAFLKAEASGSLSSFEPLPNNNNNSNNTSNYDDIETTDTGVESSPSIAAGEGDTEHSNAPTRSAGSVGTSGLSSSCTWLTTAVGNFAVSLAVLIIAQY